MRIIAAMDIINGECVRLNQGNYDTRKTYTSTPLEMAKRFEDNGITHLHLVDLLGAKSNKIQIAHLIEEIKNKTHLIIDFGGGIRTEEDLVIAFESGAQQVTVGSIALTDPQRFISWLDKYGRDRVILGADCKNRRIMTHGWLTETNKDVLEYLNEYQKHGLLYSIVTDISKDGMLQGPSFSLYKEILAQNTIQLIASGGIRSVKDLKRLRNMGCEGAIIGKAIYENNIILKQLKELW